MGWGLQFPAGLIPFSLSVDVEAWHPNDPSVGRWFLYLTSPTFQYFAFQRSCGSVGNFLIHGSSLTSSMNSVAHVLFSLRIHWFTSNGGMPVASVSYKNVTPGGGSRTSGESLKKKKKRSKSLSSSLNDKLSSLVLWAQSQNSLPITQTSAIRLIWSRKQGQTNQTNKQAKPSHDSPQRREPMCRHQRLNILF